MRKCVRNCKRESVRGYIYIDRGMYIYMGAESGVAGVDGRHTIWQAYGFALSRHFIARQFIARQCIT